MEELSVYLFYDIEDDGVRNKVSETCKDYGLKRIQFSGFLGSLDRNKREELFLRLSYILKEKEGKILLLPVCEKDMGARKEIINKAVKEESVGENVSTEG